MDKKDSCKKFLTVIKSYSILALTTSILTTSCSMVYERTMTSRFFDEFNKNLLPRHVKLEFQQKTIDEFLQENKTLPYLELRKIIDETDLPDIPVNSKVIFISFSKQVNNILITNYAFIDGEKSTPFRVLLEGFKSTNNQNSGKLNPNSNPKKPGVKEDDEQENSVGNSKNKRTILQNVNKQSQENPFTLPNSDQHVLGENQVYQDIYNRTFALGFHGLEQDQKSIINYLTQGTGWLLDYAWNSNKTKVMLYLATNAHVYGASYAPLDTKYKSIFPEYFNDDSETNVTTIKGISIGKAKKNVNLNQIENGTDPGLANYVNWFSNISINNHDRNAKDTTVITNIISPPLTVFLAVNFFDDLATKKIIAKMNSTQFQNDPGNNTKFIGKDFAVFGLEINYHSLKSQIVNNTKLSELKEQIDQAIKSLDDSISYFKNTNVPNHYLKDLPYLSVDYKSMYRLNPLNQTLTTDYNFKNFYSNTRKIHIAGYPAADGRQLFMRNYPKNARTQQNKQGVFNRHSFSLTSETVNFFGNKFTKIDGVERVANSSLFYGASGSLAMNEYGLPVGIYTNISRSNDYKDLSGDGYISFLIKTVDEFYDFTGSTPADPIVYAHNLIDGSNKTKYPRQKKSYRENLKVIDSFIDYRKTALFPEGA